MRGVTGSCTPHGAPPRPRLTGLGPLKIGDSVGDEGEGLFGRLTGSPPGVTMTAGSGATGKEGEGDPFCPPEAANRESRAPNLRADEA